MPVGGSSYPLSCPLTSQPLVCFLVLTRVWGHTSSNLPAANRDIILAAKSHLVWAPTNFFWDYSHGAQIEGFTIVETWIGSVDP